MGREVRRCAIVVGLLVSAHALNLGARQSSTAASAGAAQTAAALPPAREIVDRHVSAAGGADAFREVKSVRVKGRMEVPAQGISGTLEILGARPARVRMKLTIGGIGDAESGFDGTVGWTTDPLMGPALATGRQLAEMKSEAHFDGVLHAPDHVREMTTLARAEFDGRPAIRVRVVFESGGVEQVEYYDVETGLQIGFEASRETPMGVIATTVFLRDYKKFGAFQQPTVMVQKAMGFEQVFRFESYEYDVVPADAFIPPPAVIALIKK